MAGSISTSTWAAYPAVPSAATVPGHLPRSTQSPMAGKPGGGPVQSSRRRDVRRRWGASGTVPVVTVVSRMTLPSWTSAALAVAAVRPCLSQLTSIWAGASLGTRR